MAGTGKTVLFFFADMKRIQQFYSVSAFKLIKGVEVPSDGHVTCIGSNYVFIK